MQEENVSRNNDLVALWEQMGLSTGRFMGRMIGLSASNMLEAYRLTVTEPLRRLAASPSPAQPDGRMQGIRENTWREMGREYGETFGTSIGLAMDRLIDYMKNFADATAPGFQQPQNAGSASSNDRSVTD